MAGTRARCARGWQKNDVAIAFQLLGTKVSGRASLALEPTVDRRLSAPCSATPTMIPGPWNRPPQTLSLSANEVHIWRATLDVDGAELKALAAVLSPDEQARASRFHFEKHRQYFVAARGVLRNVLARYLQQDPGRLRFCYNASGKPALTSEGEAKTIRFNLSHSGGLALYAIAHHREVGIDLENIRPGIAWADLAKRFFSTGEVLSLGSLPPQLQIEAFFNCWTRKEAYIKALGQGLQVPLDSFEVSLDPREPAALLRGTDGRWSIRALQPASDYVAAVAADGHDWSLRLWHWQGAGQGAE